MANHSDKPAMEYRSESIFGNLHDLTVHMNQVEAEVWLGTCHRQRRGELHRFHCKATDKGIEMTAEQQIANILEAILPLVKAANNAAFALETVAHLKGMEKQVLPYAEALREAVKGIEDAVTPCAEHGSPAVGHGTLEQ